MGGPPYTNFANNPGGGGSAKWYLGNYLMFLPRAIPHSGSKEDNSQTIRGMHCQ
jgi:hypothetical protein